MAVAARRHSQSIPSVLAALKVCSDAMDLEGGRRIHADVVNSGDYSNIYVANTLVDMYAKCGSMTDAYRVFDKMPCHTLVSCNAVIFGYAQAGEGELALEIFKSMQDQGCMPDKVTFVAAIKACASLAAGKQDDEKIGCRAIGRAIHAQIVKNGHASDVYVGTTVVHMYAKLGCMVEAVAVFEKLACRTLVAWNAVILGFAENGEGEMAFFYYKLMQEQLCQTDGFTFVAILKACSSLAEPEEGKQLEGKLVKAVSLEKIRSIHARVVESGLDSNLYVLNTLVSVYSKCGSMVDARTVFDKIRKRSVVSWNAIILGYAENGEGEVAFQLYSKMQEGRYVPTRVTFVALAKACGSLAVNEIGRGVNGRLIKTECLAKGKALHKQAWRSGYEKDSFVASSLVDMYAKCGSMADARTVFDKVSSHSLALWNSIVLGYADNEEGEMALELYALMHEKGLSPDIVTFLAALRACRTLAEGGNTLVKASCLEKGRVIHHQAVATGLASNIVVENTLVDMYGKCESMTDARKVFDSISCPDVVSWTAIVLAYASSNEEELALQMFSHMQEKDMVPSCVAFLAALKACGNLAAKRDADGKAVCLENGKNIHAQVVNSGHDSNIYVANSLMDMYMKCGGIAEASRIFDNMMHHPVTSWNIMISGYTECGEAEKALQLFLRMQNEGCEPNGLTFLAVLKACSNSAAAEEGEHVEGKLLKVDSLVKGRLIHQQLTKSGQDSDITVMNTLLDMYGKCGSMSDGQKVFDSMPHRDVVTWTVMIMGYTDYGEGEVALQFYSQMLYQGIVPDRITYLAAIKACGSMAALDFGRSIQIDISKARLQNDCIIANCLLDFYGKCGSMNDAQHFFDSFESKELCLWNTLIAGYSRQGDAKHVFELIERMQENKLQPDGSTILSVLSTCCHAGLVSKGKEYFEMMGSKFKINPCIEHYTCMVDLLGRSNQLNEAVAMVNNMPFEPDLIIWGVLLGACWKWTNVSVGRIAFESILKLDDKKAAAYVMMANIYASTCLFEESERIMLIQRELNGTFSGQADGKERLW